MWAVYRCLACGYQWKQDPTQVRCSKCGHIYVLWVNYDSYDWIGDGNNGPPARKDDPDKRDP